LYNLSKFFYINPDKVIDSLEKSKHLHCPVLIIVYCFGVVTTYDENAELNNCSVLLRARWISWLL